jgi:hypothetical protein
MESEKSESASLGFSYIPPKKIKVKRFPVPYEAGPAGGPSLPHSKSIPTARLLEFAAKEKLRPASKTEAGLE